MVLGINIFSSSKTKINNIFILFILAFLSVISIDLLSSFTFIFFLILIIFFNKIFFNNNYQRVVSLFFFYTVLTVIIYWLQYFQFPQNGGCTGENIHAGTDDLFFFQESISNGISYRGDRSSFMHHYSVFLHFFVIIIGFFKKVKLIDLLFVNIFAFSFIPIFTEKVASNLKLSDKSIRYSFIFSAICPLMIINGLVLVRDGWTAMLFIAGIFFMLEKRLLFLIPTFILLFYLRASSGVILIIFVLSILFFSKSINLPKYTHSKRFTYIIIITIIVALCVPAFLLFLKLTNLEGNLFFRKGYLSFLESSSTGNSAANYIYNLNPILRIPISFIFYFGSPFLSFTDLWYNNFITARSLIGVFFPFLFLIYLIYFIRSAAYTIFSKNDRLLVIFFWCYILSILILSQLSIQIRHKTMLMPIFYILVAAGTQFKTIKYDKIAFNIVTILFVFELIYVSIPFFL